MAIQIISSFAIERNELDSFCDDLTEIALPVAMEFNGGLELYLEYPGAIIRVVDDGALYIFPSFDMILFELDGVPNVDVSGLLPKTDYYQYFKEFEIKANNDEIMANQIMLSGVIERDEIDGFCDDLSEWAIAQPIVKQGREGLELYLEFAGAVVRVVDNGESYIFPSFDMVAYELDGVPNVDISSLMSKTAYYQHL